MSASILLAQAQTKPETFLKWSMDRYHAMPSFQATVTISEQFNAFEGRSGKPKVVQRQVLFQRPNRFNITGRTNRGQSYNFVSDGTTLTECSGDLIAAFVHAAPKAIWVAGSSVMQVDAGSPVYLFFGGSANLSRLAKKDHVPISFGGEETIRGEKCRMVKFFAQGTYGYIRALIGEKSGLVYKLSYNNLPLIMMMGDPEPGAKHRKLPSPDTLDPKQADPANWFMTITESYEFTTPAKINPSSFTAQIPTGVKVMHKNPDSTKAH